MEEQKIAIIGAGLTGLSIGYFLSKHNIQFRIFEKSENSGGVIKSLVKDEFTFECGPNTGVLGSIEIENLLHDLEQNCILETASDEAKKRLIWKNNKWNELPSGLLSGICTPLFTTFDKFKILGEPFRKKGNNPDENLKELVERRLGKSFHDYAIAPFINGVYAGNTEKLITKYALPKLFALEQKYGSFIKGAIKQKRHNKRFGIQSPSKKVFSTKGGLQNFIKAIEIEIIDSISLVCNDIQISKKNTAYTITWNNKQNDFTENFSHVISTVNSKELIKICSYLTEEEKNIIEKIEYAPVVQVSLGFKQWKGININAFGGLIPPVENKDILGILFPSSMFSNRSPKDGAMLSVFMGGMLKPDMIYKTDEEIIQILTRELHYLLKIENFNPDIIHISRYKEAIAQYTIHTKHVLKTISEIENKHKNFFICGSIRDGIGMSDRVKQAHDIVKKIV